MASATLLGFGVASTILGFGVASTLLGFGVASATLLGFEPDRLSHECPTSGPTRDLTKWRHSRCAENGPYFSWYHLPFYMSCCLVSKDSILWHKRTCTYRMVDEIRKKIGINLIMHIHNGGILDKSMSKVKLWHMIKYCCICQNFKLWQMISS